MCKARINDKEYLKKLAAEEDITTGLPFGMSGVLFSLLLGKLFPKCETIREYCKKHAATHRGTIIGYVYNHRKVYKVSEYLLTKENRELLEGK
jgi:hypothetical protein